jgi:hemoglobin/transferrin/lactoferrin receptor protein
MKRILFAIIISIGTMLSYSQTLTIIDIQNKQPIQGVNIFNKSKTINVTTNQKGIAIINRFSSDDTIIISCIGYGKQEYVLDKLQPRKTIELIQSVITLDDVVFSANKFEEKKSDLPNRIEVIESKAIELSMPQNSGEILSQTGAAFVQNSQLGGSSPVLRGFEANKILLVVDGVRMNNAIYRSGHLQSIITIDPLMLDRIEVVYGPGSVIYGSDALGGVMAFHSKKPIYSTDGNLLVTGSAITKYASAANEYGGSMFINIATKKFASITNFSYKNIGDLTIGSNNNSLYGNWGMNTIYSERINNKDSAVVNSKPYTLKNSGYSQYDILQKFYYKPSEKAEYIINFQYSNSSDVPRTDRLLSVIKGKPEYAEWYYGPQTRLFTYVTAHFKNSKWFDDACFTAGYQNISEDRISRKFSKNPKKFQLETVNVFSFNADLQKNITSKNELRYGIEYTYNDVNSEAYNIDVVSFLKTYDASSRYPDESNYMMNYSAYVAHNWELSKKLILTQGIRFSGSRLKSIYSDTMMNINKFPFDKIIQQDNNAFTGQLGAIYMPCNDWRFALNLASGFRSPNIDDIGKVNDSKSGTILVIPNPDLKSEYVYNSELTISKIINKKFQFELTGFYTIIQNAIVDRATQLNGIDSVIFGGTMTAVHTNKNEGEAYICGAQGNISANISNNFSIVSNLTYTYGRVIKDNIPLDHIPPVYGMTSFRYKINKLSTDLYIRYNAWKNLKDYSPSGEDNITANPVDANGNYIGMPDWYTINLKAAYKASKFLTIQAGVENILDTHYRYFASGISAPGRNFIGALKINF